MATLTFDEICEVLADTRGMALLLRERIEKMEKALSQEMAKVREMDDILAGVVKRVGYVSEEPKKPEWVGRYFQGTDPVVDSIKSKFASAKFLPDGFQSADYNFAFDTSASPSGIPFSVALEYLKAGRVVRRSSWPLNSISIFGGGFAFTSYAGNDRGASSAAYRPDSRDLLATDWMVVPEPQNP